MTAYPSDVHIERRAAALWVTLTRPAAYNAITPAMVSGLQNAMDTVDADPSIRALVLTGGGKAFCAGADLKAVLELGAGDDANRTTSVFLRDVGHAFNRLSELGVPTVAAINGVALAGGLELLLCCDMVVAASATRFGDAHANFGQIPGGGGTVRLPRRIGASKAKRLMFTGETITAEQALDWGLVDQLCAPDMLVASVEELVSQIAQKSSLVLARMKKLVNAAAETSAGEALAAELALSDLHMTSHDRNEGLTAFSEKRTPSYLGC